MAQVSYGTITITDTNDIEKIYMEYAQSTSNQTAPTSGWDTDIPTWQQGKYIWQRTVTKMSGVALSPDSYGEPVCLTGSTGSTGAAGRSVSSIVTTYCNYGDGTPADNYSGWQSTVPAYDSTKPNYWVKTDITYSNPTETSTTKYKDNGITSATSTAAAANSLAQTANNIANQAKETAGEAKTIAEGANSVISDLNQYFWRQKTAATNVPAGSYVTNIPGTTYKNNPANGGFSSLVQANGIFLRNGITTLSSWTGDALTFNNPSTGNAQLIIGANGTLQSGNYVRGNDSKFASTGSKIDLTNGDIITTYFRVSQGLEPGLPAGAYIHGTVEATEGKIGADSTNYWEIGQYTDYNLTTNATMVGHGGSFIQLGDSSTWRLATNRLHTGWYSSGDTTLNYPTIDSKYWDFGIHAPTSKTDKFVYIRSSKDTTDSSGILQRLLYDIDDTYTTSQWDYQFYIDGSGNVHAPGFYIGDSTTPIGGGAGTVAERLTQGYGSATQPIYFNSNGVPTKTTYTLNAAGAKGVDTSISAASTSTNLPTSQAVAAFVEGKGYITSYVDNKVQTSQANTTKIFLAGTSTAGTSTGTLNFDSNVYLTTTAGTLHATTFEGNLSGTASRATADGDGNKISTTYLKLSGGNVTGAVTFGSSVSADELTVGDLVVNGAASFTNNLQANTINGVEVGANPKFTDTVTTVTTSGNGNAVTAITASNGKLTVTKGTTFLTSYTETDPIFVASAAHGITSDDISNWNSKTSNTGTVTSAAASGSGGITISGSPITTSGTITIGLNLSTAINGLGEGTSPANRDDYIVAQYAGGGTTTTTYHRRKLSNIFAALNKSDITTALGYTPPTQDTNTHYTTHLYVNNNTTTNQNTTTALTNGNVYLHLYDDSTKRDSHKISGSGTVSVTSDTSGNIVITGSAHPTSLKNPNALSIKVYNGTSSSTNTSYDGSTANQSVSVAGTNAITGINSTTDGKLQLTLADGSQPDPISIKITATTSDSAASADKLNLSANVGSLTQPVYFDANTGLPVATTYSLNKTVPSDAKFTDTWIAMVGATSSANGTAGYVSAPPKDGYNTKFLRADGTWVVPGGTYSLPLAASGTRGGVQIGYTANGKNYPVQLSSEKMYVNVPWENTTYSAGTGLSLTGTTFSNTGVTGVKGNSESSYRTGQVNLTPANLGAVRGNSYLFYGTCDTEAATAEKEVTCTGFTSNDLQPGAVINVYFTVTNSAAVANLQLNVNGTGAKPIRYIYNGSYSNIPGAGYIKLNQVYQFTYDGTYWIVQMIYNTDADWRVKSDYGRYTAGTSGLLPYALVMQASDGRWESITTTSTTAKTKAKNTTGFLLDSIFYRPSSSTVAEGAIDSTWTMYSCNVCDARYHFNIENTTALKLNNGNAIYLVGTIGSDGLFYLDDTWWAQSLPTTADGKYYVYLGTVYSWYQYNLDVFHPVYKFINGKVRNVSLDAISVNGHTINSDVPSNAKFTDTWNALSTSQAGYVAKAPNDTGKFLRGDATWAAVTKANVGLGNVENTALSTWTGTNKITTVGTITTGTWNGSAIPITHGGTGQTTAAKAIDALLNGLPTWTANPTDSTYFIRQDTGGSATYGKAQFSTLWNYISGKISNSKTYVTIAGDNETITGTKSFNNILGTKYVATKNGVGCEINYNSTLDALVFTFA